MSMGQPVGANQMLIKPEDSAMHNDGVMEWVKYPGCESIYQRIYLMTNAASAARSDTLSKLTLLADADGFRTNGL